MSSPEALTVVTYSLATGGSERVAADVARHVAGRGVRTSVCSTHGDVGPIGESLLADGIPCVPAGAGGGGRPGRAWRLFRHFRRSGTTVAHVHHFNMLAAAYRAARLAGVRRIVVTEHSDYQMRTRTGARERARKYGPLADLVTVVHDGLASYLDREIGIPRDRVAVISNGVDTAAFRPGDRIEARRAVGLPLEGVLAGSVGRLHPDKDPVNFVEAFSRLNRDDGARAVLVGDGPERQRVEDAIVRAGLGDRVLLLGERHDVSLLLRALDVFVLPSRTEGLPVALLEAMSSGIPIVATEVGGVAAAVGDAGITVPSEDPAALATAIAALVRDPDRRARCGLRGRQRAIERYDRSVMFAAYRRALFPDRDGIEC